MTMRYSILLLYNKGLADILNRKSALGSYIKVLCDLLSKENDLYVNGDKFGSLYYKDYELKTTISKDVTNVRKNATLKGEIKRRFYNLFLLVKDCQEVAKSFIITFRSTRDSKKYDRIIEFYSYLSLSGFLVSKIRKLPLIIIYDAPVDEEFTYFNDRASLLLLVVNLFQKMSLQQATHIVVYSKSVANHIQNKFQLDDAKIKVHQNVDFSRFVFFKKNEIKKGSTINLGFIGSFLKWHRVDLLVHAFEKLMSKGYNLHLYLIGDGMEMGNIKKMVAQSPYKNSVTLTGFLDGVELSSFKQVLHIGIMPSSNWYGAPAKIFEYGAAGMAVVAPNTPTIRDLFADGKEILLAENNSKESLQQTIENYCTNQTLLFQHSKNLQKKIIHNYNERRTLIFYSSLLN